MAARRRSSARPSRPTAPTRRRTSERAAKKEDPTQAFIIGGVLLVALLIPAIAMMGGSDTEPEPRRRPKPQPTELQSTAHLRIQKLRAWQRALQSGSGGLTLERHVDAPALARSWGMNTDGESAKLVEAVLSKLTTDEEKGAIRFIREMAWDSGYFEDPSHAESATGTVIVSLSPPTFNDPLYKGAGKVDLGFKMYGEEPRVTSLVVRKRPNLKRKPKPAYVAHEEIERPEEVTEVINGQKMTFKESKLIPLGHFEETPAAARAEIDKLVGQMVDPDTAKPNRIVDELVGIGRPAIPRLLNQLYELHKDIEGNIVPLRRLVQTLRQTSGNSYGFVMMGEPGDPEATPEKRLAALRRWYAWWYEFHAGDYQLGIDKTEYDNLDDLLKTEKEKAAEKAAQEAAGGASDPKKGN